MNVGGSIYILKGNFSLKLEKVLDPPFNESELSLSIKDANENWDNFSLVSSIFCPCILITSAEKFAPSVSFSWEDSDIISLGNCFNDVQIEH